MGNQALEVNSQSIQLGFFDIFSDGELRFANPKVEFTFENEFGFPIGVDYSRISALGFPPQMLSKAWMSNSMMITY